MKTNGIEIFSFLIVTFAKNVHVTKDEIEHKVFTKITSIT